MVYICLDNPERSIQRVRERVAQGGHNVPDDDVRRRYARSLSNLKQVATIVNETIIYDNSGPEPTLALEIRSGSIVSDAAKLPPWVRKLLEGVRL